MFLDIFAIADSQRSKSSRFVIVLHSLGKVPSSWFVANERYVKALRVCHSVGSAPVNRLLTESDQKHGVRMTVQFVLNTANTQNSQRPRNVRLVMSFQSDGSVPTSWLLAVHLTRYTSVEILDVKSQQRGKGCT